MRSFAVALSLLVAGSAKVCDSEDKAGATASASAAASANVDAKASLAAPRIGGAVTSVGDFSVELALHQSGLVEALVTDAKGQLVSTGVELSATVQARGGAAQQIQLGFVPPRGRFVGHAGAGAELVAGPVQVALGVAGKKLAGRLDAAIVLPRPRLGGHMLAAGAFAAELFVTTSGEVQALIENSAGVELTTDANASFTARVGAQGGAREELALSFDAARAAFIGKAKAGITLAPGPLELIASAKVGGGLGRLENVGLSVQATHGGQIVAVGDYSLELLAKGNQLSAFVFDASGKAHVAGDLKLLLDVGASAGANAGLALKWDAPSLSYVGSAAAGVNLALQPLRISLTASGKAFSGAVASLDGAAQANAKLKGTLNAGAKLDADANVAGKAALSAGAKAKVDSAAKAGAAVKLTPPKLDVSANKSVSAGAKTGGAKAGGGAKASAGFSIGTK